MESITTGHDRMGEFAPKFAELNDDVLFGEVWSREDRLSARDRSMVTIAALMSGGNFPQLKSHLTLGKQHGITQTEVTEILTQLGFYCEGHSPGSGPIPFGDGRHNFLAVRGVNHSLPHCELHSRYRTRCGQFRRHA